MEERIITVLGYIDAFIVGALLGACTILTLYEHLDIISFTEGNSMNQKLWWLPVMYLFPIICSWVIRKRWYKPEKKNRH